MGEMVAQRRARATEPFPSHHGIGSETPFRTLIHPLSDVLHSHPISRARPVSPSLLLVGKEKTAAASPPPSSPTPPLQRVLLQRREQIQAASPSPSATPGAAGRRGRDVEAERPPPAEGRSAG